MKITKFAKESGLAGVGAADARLRRRPLGPTAHPRSLVPRRLGERIILAALFLCGTASILTTIGIVAVLIVETAAFFREVSPLEFLTGTQWAPLFQPQHFGVLPLVAGTTMVAAGAILVAAPLGLGGAIYLSEYGPDRLRRALKPLLEVLAGIPTVVYGYFALTFITPILQAVIPATNIFNAASAAIVIGIMITPLILSISEDAMRAVPAHLREAAYGLGATKFTVSTRVVVPAAVSGIAASFILGVSRAIGETMVVAIAAGATPKLTWNPLESTQTMTAYIVQVSLGDVPTGSLEYKTIFAVGAGLFLITLALNLISQRVVRRIREVY